MNDKRNIKISIILLSIMLFISNIGMAVDYDKENVYVTDKAGVLSDYTIDHIKEVNKGLKETGAEIAVLTLNNLNGQDIKSLATQVFEDWGIGDKDKNNGLLILLAVEERSVEVEVGYGLEGAIPDSKVVRILKEDFAPNAADDNFDKAVLESFDSYVMEVMREYDIDSLSNLEMEDEQERSSSFSIVLLLILVMIIINILINKMNDDDDNFRGGGSGRPRPRSRRTIYWGGSMGSPRSGGFGGSSNGGFGGGRSGGGGGGIKF